MALKNDNTGEYLKIYGLFFDFSAGILRIDYFLFANEEQRIRFDSGLNPYEIVQRLHYTGYLAIKESLNDIVSDILPVKDAIFKALYKTLKNDRFSSWIDC